MTRLFPYHRTTAPMLWVFVGLAATEMVVVHLFLALRWPWLAWPLLLVSLATVWWLVGWIRSMKRLPHALEGGLLRLRMGKLREVAVPLSSISFIATSWMPGGHKGAGAANMVPVADANRLLQLLMPLPPRGKVDRIAFRVDEPAAFDEAMREQGVQVR